MSFMIDETGQRILRLIDVHKDQIIAFAEDIAAHPEPGYEEFCTAGKTAEVLKKATAFSCVRFATEYSFRPFAANACAS